MSSTSIGRGPASGGNENHDGDPLHTTMGETVGQEPPAGNELINESAFDTPAAVPGAQPPPGIAKGPKSVRRQPDPARGKPSKP